MNKSDKQLTQLLRCRKAAASITPTLRDDLHWFPIPEKIVFKFCSIIFKCHHQTALQCLQELFVPVTAVLVHTACSTSSFGPRSCAACAPKLWNSLPSPLRETTLTLTLFCTRLRSTCLTNLKSLSLPTTKVQKAIQKSENWVVWAS